MAEYINYEETKIHKKVKIFHIKDYSFSSIEIKHLTFAMLMIILTIFAFQQKTLIFSKEILSINTLISFLVYFFTIGLGFILHELGHKLVAQHYGFISEFRADFQMLILMFGLALISPFIFLAPGAVMILGRVTKKQNGIISVAGPLVNLALAIIFIILGQIFTSTGILGTIIYLGIWVNAFLGIFNMLPIKWLNLDGFKVLAWNKSIYAIVMISLILILLGHINGIFI